MGSNWEHALMPQGDVGGARPHKQMLLAIQGVMYGVAHCSALQPYCLYQRFAAMIFPSLTEAERTALEEMAVHGPSRTVPVPIRGRLALYKLIDETPEGWRITAFGRQCLQVPPPVAESTPNPKKGSSRSSESGRHYGKKTRDTSWFG
jgi:hypothetical protein